MTGTPTKILTGRYLVRRRQIIDASLPSNSNCCGREEKKQHSAPPIAARKPIQREETVPSPPSEFIIEVPKQSAAVVSAVAEEKAPLFYELLCNAWPSSTERVENLAITWKRCQFSNEAISIKPITASMRSSARRRASWWYSVSSTGHRQEVRSDTSRSRIHLCTATARLLHDSERWRHVSQMAGVSVSNSDVSCGGR